MPYERKIINDPVFGFINIPKGLLYDIVRHPLLQRLTRIKQVGLSSVVYPGAQHTRFQHSLGAFYLMSEAITQLTSKGNFTKVSHPLKHQLFSFSFVCLPPYPLTVNTCLTEVMQTIHILRPIFPTLQPLQGFCSSLCRFR